MPTYDFVCRNWGRDFDVFMSFSEYGQRKVKCVHCGSVSVRRRMTKVRIARSEESRLDSLADDSSLQGLEDDPRAYVRSKTYTKIDDHTLHISAGKPYPLLPNEMSVLYIYPRPASVDDFNAGKAMVGTGPYKFKEWIKGDRLVLERKPDYWGEKPEWDRVVFKVITAGPSRVAALLNGDVDIIAYVPTPDVPA